MPYEGFAFSSPDKFNCLIGQVGPRGQQLVTTLANDGPGSLRTLATAGSAWIGFALSGTITLSEPIVLGSNVVIDGRNQAITVANQGLWLEKGAGNVIIENLTLRGLGSSGQNGVQNDGIHLQDEVHDVWIDHCAFAANGDESVGITHSSTDVTISWSRFEAQGPGNAVLIGRSATDTADVATRVTIHHNYFKQINNYAPRVRFGQVHFFDNFVDRWANGAAAVTMNGELLLESNVWTAATNKIAVTTSTTSDATSGRFHATADNVYLGGAIVDPKATDTQVFTPQYRYTPSTVGQVSTEVAASAGPR